MSDWFNEWTDKNRIPGARILVILTFHLLPFLLSSLSLSLSLSHPHQLSFGYPLLISLLEIASLLCLLDYFSQVLQHHLQLFTVSSPLLLKNFSLADYNFPTRLSLSLCLFRPLIYLTTFKRKDDEEKRDDDSFKRWKERERDSFPSFLLIHPTHHLHFRTSQNKERERERSGEEYDFTERITTRVHNDYSLLLNSYSIWRDVVKEMRRGQDSSNNSLLDFSWNDNNLKREIIIKREE